MRSLFPDQCGQEPWHQDLSSAFPMSLTLTSLLPLLGGDTPSFNLSTPILPAGHPRPLPDSRDSPSGWMKLDALV